MTNAEFSRRELFLGKAAANSESHVHVSSAIVFARPDVADGVEERLRREFGVEVHARRGTRLVIVMEAPTAGELGELLTRISLAEGVIAANMVFEQMDSGEEPGA
jgi:nitrate reductase NapD